MGLGLIRTEEAHVDLSAGDAVLFHTDGITEARSPAGEQFGRQRLADVVVEALRRDERPAELLRHVVQAASTHTGGPVEDDASAVFLRRGRTPD
jgi:serine phosphatase RsbU (regulator of sigma subunit)